MSRKDPYAASLAVTLFFFYGTAALLAWIADRWPLGFATGLVLFFLLIYGKLNFVFRRLRRSPSDSAGRSACGGQP